MEFSAFDEEGAEVLCSVVMTTGLAEKIDEDEIGRHGKQREKGDDNGGPLQLAQLHILHLFCFRDCCIREKSLIYWLHKNNYITRMGSFL